MSRSSQAIADESGGEYFEVYGADQVAFAANYAVQSVFRRRAEFDANSESEFQTAAPIVGTVDLTGAKDINGAAPAELQHLHRRRHLAGHNVLITSGFGAARVRGAASARSAPTSRWPDASQPHGYKFVKDGTPLWVAHARQRAASATSTPTSRALGTSRSRRPTRRRSSPTCRLTDDCLGRRGHRLRPAAAAGRAHRLHAGAGRRRPRSRPRPTPTTATFATRPRAARRSTLSTAATTA